MNSSKRRRRWRWAGGMICEWERYCYCNTWMFRLLHISLSTLGQTLTLSQPLVLFVFFHSVGLDSDIATVIAAAANNVRENLSVRSCPGRGKTI
jgi:hypothetical protein